MCIIIPNFIESGHIVAVAVLSGAQGRWAHSSPQVRGLVPMATPNEIFVRV